MPVTTPASPWLRFAAIVYDLFPLAGLWMLVAAIALSIVHGDVDVAHPGAAYRASLQAALLVVSAAYFVVSWARGGQTIGMRAWRLRVVDEHGQSLPWARSLLRFATALFSFALFGVGFAWCFVDARGRGWHDLAARSIVVRQPPRG